MAPSWLAEDCAIGIDEAGRGPVLGPMVYGCAYCPVESLDYVASLGFDDSKKLTEERRDELFDVVKQEARMGWAVDVSSPQDLSAQMLSREKVSLNVIALESTAKLIQGVLDLGTSLVAAYVDTVGDPDKYKAMLSRKFPSIDFTVSKKADSLFPIVSAASVVAKVTRDRTLREWVTAEPRDTNGAPADGTKGEEREDTACSGADAEAPEDALPAASASVLGSGYPADPGTKKWLLNNQDPVFGFPALVRFSWQTAQKLMDEGCVRVHWGNEEDEEPVAERTPSSAKRLKKKVVCFESCAPQRHSFFRTRQLQLLTQGL